MLGIADHQCRKGSPNTKALPLEFELSFILALRGFFGFGVLLLGFVVALGFFPLGETFEGEDLELVLQYQTCKVSDGVWLQMAARGMW